MLLVDWRSLLNTLKRALIANLEVQLVEDLTQIEGLCERMDTQAFLPIRGEELTVASPRRIIQFTEIVNDLVALLTQREFCSTKGLRPAATAVAFGRYMWTAKARVGVFLEVDHRKWSQLASTPFWLRIHGQNWKPTPALRQLLQPIDNKDPQMVFEDPDYPPAPCVPLFPRLGVERDAVLADLLKQLSEVIQLLDVMPATAEPELTPPPPELPLS